MIPQPKDKLRRHFPVASIAKKVVSLLMALAALPLVALLVIAFRLKMADYRTASQALALMPDFFGGVYMRRWWYRSTIRCGRSLVVGWLSVIESPSTCLGDRVYMGSRVSIGLANIGNDVMFSSGVVVVSGSKQHGTSRGAPMNTQPGQGKVRVLIGDDVWIGAGAYVAADIADGCVVGMGSVVAKPLSESYVVVAGNPARIVRTR